MSAAERCGRPNKEFFPFSPGEKVARDGVLTSRRGPDEGSLPARGRTPLTFTLAQRERGGRKAGGEGGKKVAAGRSWMRGPVDPRLRAASPMLISSPKNRR
jgi:hypothetical protein